MCGCALCPKLAFTYGAARLRRALKYTSNVRLYATRNNREHGCRVKLQVDARAQLEEGCGKRNECLASLSGHKLSIYKSITRLSF